MVHGLAGALAESRLIEIESITPEHTGGIRRRGWYASRKRPALHLARAADTPYGQLQFGPLGGGGHEGRSVP